MAERWMRATAGSCASVTGKCFTARFWSPPRRGRCCFACAATFAQSTRKATPGGRSSWADSQRYLHATEAVHKLSSFGALVVKSPAAQLDLVATEKDQPCTHYESQYLLVASKRESEWRTRAMLQAPDLRRGYSRSPAEVLGGFVL